MKHYSQGGEEPVILEYFDTFVGRFLELGAWDGRCMSNCYALANERGWSGTCVEPDPDALAGLRRTYADNPRIAIVDAAVTPETGRVTFHSSRGGGVSTTNHAHRTKWESASKFETIEVQSITPTQLLELHPGPYQMFSLDVEGESANLLELFPLKDMGVELLVVEHDNAYDRVLSYCARYGLRHELYRSGENLIVAR
jgi:FkbM family methyltransferase